MIQIYFGVLVAAAMMLVGGYIFVTLNKKYPKSIGLLLGLSGGFLLGIIFFGIIPEAHEILEEAFDAPLWVMAAALTGGALFIILFEKMIPVQHHHDLVPGEREHHGHHQLVYIILVAWFMIIVIGLHNIPIGFVIIAQLETLECSQKKCLLLIGGLAVAEALLAIVCYLILMPFITTAFQGVLLAMTGGIMLYLVFDELLPKIYQDEEQHHVNYMIILGVLLMYVFLQLAGH